MFFALVSVLVLTLLILGGSCKYDQENIIDNTPQGNSFLIRSKRADSISICFCARSAVCGMRERAEQNRNEVCNMVDPFFRMR